MADAVVIPGGAFGPAAGLLMYAGAVAVLGRVVTAMNEFLDAIAWSGRG